MLTSKQTFFLANNVQINIYKVNLHFYHFY